MDVTMRRSMCSSRLFQERDRRVDLLFNNAGIGSNASGGGNCATSSGAQ